VFFLSFFRVTINFVFVFSGTASVVGVLPFAESSEHCPVLVSGGPSEVRLEARLFVPWAPSICTGSVLESLNSLVGLCSGDSVNCGRLGWRL